MLIVEGKDILANHGYCDLGMRDRTEEAEYETSIGVDNRVLKTRAPLSVPTKKAS